MVIKIKKGVERGSPAGKLGLSCVWSLGASLGTTLLALNLCSDRPDLVFFTTELQTLLESAMTFVVVVVELFKNLSEKEFVQVMGRDLKQQLQV